MRYLIPFALAPLAMLAACDAGSPDAPSPEGTAQGSTPPAQEAAPPSPTPTPSETGTDGINDGNPDLTPPTLTPEAEKTETGARNVLTSWARAIELQEYDQAWSLMSDADQAKWSKAAFARLFADLDEITVAVPGGTMEGAAGSSYYTVPVTITATDPDGRPVRYEGEMVLRRVNDVPGATPEQLRWHVESTTLDWTH